MTRILSPYEHNHLVRFGFNPKQISEHGEKPVEYITGHVTFKGQDFLIDEQTLIPRLETEELVDQAVQDIIQSSKTRETGAQPIHVADVGTGCGAITIATLLELLKQNQSVSLDFWLSDISAEALRMTHKNIQRLLPGFQPEKSGSYRYAAQHNHHNIALHIFQSDVMKEYPVIPFDFILANLPYIPSERISVLDASVKDFEPHLALDGGVEGLDLIHTLLEQAKNRLATQGKITLEIDYTHTPSEISTDPYWDVQVVFDSFHRQRFAVVTQAR